MGKAVPVYPRCLFFYDKSCAQAARALTFCHLTESKQRANQREGVQHAPLWKPPGLVSCPILPLNPDYFNSGLLGSPGSCAYGKRPLLNVSETPKSRGQATNATPTLEKFCRPLVRSESKPFPRNSATFGGNPKTVPHSTMDRAAVILLCSGLV